MRYHAVRRIKGRKEEGVRQQILDGLMIGFDTFAEAISSDTSLLYIGSEVLGAPQLCHERPPFWRDYSPLSAPSTKERCFWSISVGSIRYIYRCIPPR
jgi:hypothetical protein